MRFALHRYRPLAAARLAQVMGVLDAMSSSNLKPEDEAEELQDRVYRTTYMFSATMPQVRAPGLGPRGFFGLASGSRAPGLACPSVLTPNKTPTYIVAAGRCRQEITDLVLLISCPHLPAATMHVVCGPGPGKG